MSTVAIHYQSLKNASTEANDVSKKLSAYADALDNKVIKKLDKYSGSWSSNLSNARTKTSDKIEELRTESTKFSDFSQSLSDLKIECETVDKAVKTEISKLTTTFKEAYGIRNSKVENSIRYFCTSIGNSTAFGRWLNGEVDNTKSKVDYFKSTIKTWYNYGGGKQLIKGLAIGLLSIAGAILAIAVAIISGGALIAVIAAVVAGAIALVNGFCDIYNEVKAYQITRKVDSETNTTDPSIGRRRSKIDSFQDYMRSSFWFGETGEEYRYSKGLNIGAGIIDGVNLVCAGISLVYSIKDLIGNGYKWATNTNKVEWGKVFTKETLTATKTKVGQIFKSFKTEGWTVAKDIGKNILKDFSGNFKKEFWNFKDMYGKLQWKESLKCVKNILGVGKELIKEDFKLSSICKVGLVKVILPSVTVFKVEGTEAELVFDKNGIGYMDFMDEVVAKDFFEGVKDTKEFFADGGTFLGKTVFGASGAISKLTNKCDVDISIPVINVPDIKIPEVYIPNMNLSIIR